MSCSFPILLFMLFAHVGKLSNSRSQMFLYCEIFPNSFFIKDLFNIPFPFFFFFFFFFLIDNWYFRVIFYYCKIRPRNRKNFAIDRPNFSFFFFFFCYLIISLLQRFVSSSNCKEKRAALNWTILVSNFSKLKSAAKVLLKISQNLWENTCDEVSFLIKLQVTLLKKRLCVQVFSYEFCEILKNTFFIEHFP